MRHRLIVGGIWAALLVVLAGCDTLAVPTLQPTRVLSGPTLEATAPAIPLPPSEVPSSFYDTRGSSDPTAAAMPNDLELPPLAVTSSGDGRQTMQITLTDALVLADLYDNVPVRAPGVLLIAESRAAWGDFPRELEASGYTVLVVELTADMPIIDFQQAMTSFVELSQSDGSRLDPGRIAVIGSLSGADIVLRGCAVDLRCDMAALLTPTQADGALLVLNEYDERPVLTAASATHTAAYPLAEQIAGNVQNGVFQPFQDAGDGAAMLQNRPDFSGLLISWINRELR